MPASTVSPLQSAAANGDLDSLRSLLAAGADPNSRCHTSSWYPRSPLVTAMIYGQLEALRLLLDAGGHVSTDDVSHGLGWGKGIGASDSKAPLLRFLLERGLNPNEGRDREDGSTLLMGMLGHSDCHELVPLLLEYGADIHARDAAGCTPFMYAATLYSEDNIRLLAREGADVDAQDARGRSALMKVLFIHEEDWDMLTDRRAPMGFFEWEEDEEWFNERRAERLRVVLDCGVNIHLVDSRGWNALLLALGFGNEPCSRLLLERGASLRGLDEKDIRRTRRLMQLHHYNKSLRLLDALLAH